MKSFFSINEIIEKHTSTNVFAVAITPWQAIGIDASIEYLSENNVDTKDVIFIRKHSKTGICINEEAFEKKNNRSFYTIDEINHGFFKKMWIFLSIIKYLLTTNKNSNQITYIICPLKPSWDLVRVVAKCRKDSKIVLFVTSDGIGDVSLRSYNNLLTNNINDNIIFPSLKARIETITNNILELLFINRNELIDFRMVSKKRKEVTINSNFQKYYINVLKRKRILDSYLNSKYRHAIIFNTQLEENKLISNIEKTIIKQCVDYINKKGVKCVFKPHPRDNNEKRLEFFDSFIDKRRAVAQESIIASLNEYPLLIISTTSTSLITLNLLFSIKTVSLAKIIINELKELDELSNLHEFVSSFSSIVYCPNTIDELYNYIDEKTK